MAENDDPQDWPPLTAFYHYAGPSSSSQSNAPSSTTAAAEATTTNASPPHPIAVTTTYNDGTTTTTTNHTAPVTILIFQNPIHPSFYNDENDDKNGNNSNKNESDPPLLDPSRSPPQPRRCAGCHKDFASTTTTAADTDADADTDDIATFPVLAGPHCDCTFHAGCLAQPYFDSATVLPVCRRNMACPACGGEGFAGREAEMGCWEDEDDGWEEGIVSERDGGYEDGDDDDDDIVQFEMVPREAAAVVVVVTEGMVVVRLESEWEEEEEQEEQEEEQEVVEVAEGRVARRAVAFAVIVKWASGDGEEGKQAQRDGQMPGDPVLPGCEQQLASLALDMPQQQQSQEKTVASAEEKEDFGPV
ncbi:hypothetical protein DIS24_g3907 [Lasiodiplodia hormozganensis]|uniref:Uncharacterized protein n=1 Tax=Lasiodiplodia hormozganensis TaxID=869390 RepID=A0AA39YWY6_9PEZI|nr:hypothetical protein DIS24_g3907 [Lasiodiplodia hormozganensis]